MKSPEQLPSRLTVVALHDASVEGAFPAEADYVTFCYRPRLGPTSLVTYRFLATLLADRDSAVVEVVDAARNLGLRASKARNAPLATALNHLVAFGLAEWRADEYALRLAVPPLSKRQADRLPESARSFHYQAMRGSSRP